MEQNLARRYWVFNARMLVPNLQAFINNEHSISKNMLLLRRSVEVLSVSFVCLQMRTNVKIWRIIVMPCLHSVATRLVHSTVHAYKDIRVMAWIVMVWRINSLPSKCNLCWYINIKMTCAISSIQWIFQSTYATTVLRLNEFGNWLTVDGSKLINDWWHTLQVS